jgi:paraquat-inducible protein B
MVKHAKKQEKTDDEIDSSDVMASMRRGLVKLDAHIEKLPEALDSEESADLAHLLSKMAVVNAELRKAEHAARNADAEITPTQMLERVRRMPTAERHQFMRTVQNLNADAGKSGLA